MQVCNQDNLDGYNSEDDEDYSLTEGEDSSEDEVVSDTDETVNTAPRLCSVCRLPGHRVETCPERRPGWQDNLEHYDSSDDEDYVLPDDDYESSDISFSSSAGTSSNDDDPSDSSGDVSGDAMSVDDGNDENEEQDEETTAREETVRLREEIYDVMQETDASPVNKITDATVHM